MTPVARGVLDTSVFIASESGRPLPMDALPGESAVSVVTLAELQAGVLAATSTAIRARRLATLSAVSDLLALDITEAVALTWAHLRVRLAEAGRKVNVNDSWIAATALTHNLPVVTQDDDFQPLSEICDLVVVRI